MKKEAKNLIQIRTRVPIMVNPKMHEIKMSLVQCFIIKALRAFNQRKKHHLTPLLGARVT